MKSGSREAISKKKDGHAFSHRLTHAIGRKSKSSISGPKKRYAAPRLLKILQKRPSTRLTQREDAAN
jgi:hypothetical protein